MDFLARFLKAWPIVAHIGKFFHLIEDDLEHISLSGVQLWASTYASLHSLFASSDHTTQAVAVGNNVLAGALHAVKRFQTLKFGK